MSSTRRAGIAAVDGKLYVAGGAKYSSGVNNTLYVYDPLTNKWAQKASLITAAACYNAPQMIHHEGELYFFGNVTSYTSKGQINGAASQKYNIAANKWYKIKSVDGSSVAAAGMIDNNIFLLSVGNLYKYKYDSDTWEQINSQTLEPNRISIFVDNKVYVPNSLANGETDSRLYVLDLSSFSNIPSSSISVSPPSKTLEIGETTNLIAEITPANATDKSVTWTSSDDTVATVDANGTVTAVAAGQAVITATAANGVSATASITVNESGDSASKRLSLYLDTGDTAKLCVTDNIDDNTSFTWSSDNETVATVDSNGVVTGVSEGLCNISAQDSSGFKQTLTVRVGEVEPEVDPTPELEVIKVNDNE